MLQFLETGKAIYALAAVCLLGILSKWLTRSLYKRLIKETDNMALTKNRSLRAFKQRAESTYRINQGIPHVRPYLEKQMYELKFSGFSLNGWGTFSNQMTLLCFLLGGAAAFACYWYRVDSAYTVLYGSAGILAGLLTILVDNGVNLTDKKQQLFVSLENYMENTMLNRLDKERMQDQQDLREAAEVSRAGAKESLRSSKLQSDDGGRDSGQATVRRRGSRPARREVLQEEPIKERSSGRDIDYLKKSLEQIAASREKSKGGKSQENWLEDLNPDEMKLIGEIIKEYLA